MNACWSGCSPSGPARPSTACSAFTLSADASLLAFAGGDDMSWSTAVGGLRQDQSALVLRGQNRQEELMQLLAHRQLPDNDAVLQTRFAYLGGHRFGVAGKADEVALEVAN